MKVFRLAALMVFAFIVSATSAMAYSRNFLIVNETAVPITRVEFSVHGMRNWIPSGNDNTISPGQQRYITFNNSNGPCLMQLRVNFSNGAHASWRDGFNFCSVEKVEIRWNGISYVAHYTYAR